jgi:arsenate reductase
VSNSTSNVERLVESLRDYVRRIVAHDAPNERQSQLGDAATFISERLASGQSAELTYICTHNSRRSHFAHVWAQTAARFYGLKGINNFSGGTEVTSCNPRTVQAFVRAGFSVEIPSDLQANPTIKVHHHFELPPIECFSKEYLDGGNPTTDFAAMMCCSDVDETCPIVSGAAIRIPLHYDDPKLADDTPEEEARYDERCWQIGCDMFQMMAMVETNRSFDHSSSGKT